ncbi:MAG: metallophosphoesterase, partial [Campylobacterales bacterium]
MRYLGIFILSTLTLFAQSFWVQVAEDGYEFRVTTNQNTPCPSIKVDGKRVQSSTRFEAQKSFQTKVCSHKLNNPKKIEYQKSVIDIPQKLEKVAIIGDTGCRVKIKKNTLNDKNLQECSDSNKWPAKKIASLIKKQNPDLIIHVGDYVYREMCENPHICDKYEIGDWHLGKGYKTWEADFLEPFSELLSSTPWVFVRGNHENCNREWLGYKAMLSPYSFSECKKSDDGYSLAKNATEEPYSFSIGSDSFVVFDSAGENDRKAKRGDYERYLKWFGEYKGRLQNSWLITHKPVYNLNFNAQTSQRQALEMAKVETPLILSGHIHMFEWVNSSPLQMIVGNSGTKLDDFKNRLSRLYPDSFLYGEFGYVVATPAKNKQEFILYDDKNSEV